MKRLHDILARLPLRNGNNGLQYFIFETDEDWRTVIPKSDEKL
jgi:hypothetical protein